MSRTMGGGGGVRRDSRAKYGQLTEVTARVREARERRLGFMLHVPAPADGHSDHNSGAWEGGNGSLGWLFSKHTARAHSGSDRSCSPGLTPSTHGLESPMGCGDGLEPESEAWME
jgi:hypothetical protein